MESLQPTAPSAWKNKVVVAGTPVQLPSTNVALLRQLSPMAFLESGIIPDPLTKIVRESIHNKKGMPPAKVKKMMEDPEQTAAAMEMVDRAVCHIVVEPVIEMPPTCTECGEYANQPQHKRGAEGGHRYAEGPRDGEVLYADEVDLTDKMFVFQWALGGVSKLDSFRAELDAGMESLSDGSDAPLPTL